MMDAHSKVLNLLPDLTEAEQLSVIVELVQGGKAAGCRSDAFIDALMPVDNALCDAFDVLAGVTGFDRRAAA